MKSYKIFQTSIILSITRFGIIAATIFLFNFLLIPKDCFSQYIPEAGDKVMISLIDDEKAQLFETASDSSRHIHEISNGDTLKILEKEEKWLNVELSNGKIGWLCVDPVISNFMLIHLGPCRHKEPASKQKDEAENEFWMLNASTEFRNIPDAWDIRYYGIEPEFFLSDKFSVSGHFYAGKGSDNHTYVHFPVFGLLVSVTFGFILNEVFDGEFYTKEIFRFLIVENFNYHKRLNKFFMVSPYLNLLGMDISELYGPNRDITGLLSNGIGLKARLLLGERVSIGSSIGWKHFIDLNSSFGSKYHCGYTVGVNFGIVF
jgi:hypothetical protein